MPWMNGFIGKKYQNNVASKLQIKSVCIATLGQSLKAQGQRCRWETFFLNLMKWGLDQKKTTIEFV